MEIDMEAIMELMVVPATVVQNDKPAKAKKAAAAVKPVTATEPQVSVVVLPGADSKAETLGEMEEKRKNWETTAYRTSNQQLYAVLADCLTYGRELPFADSKQRNKELETFLKSRDYRVKNDSPLLTRVVKAVFGNIDRRRISTYSLVLRTAQKEGVKPTELANWIEERGGVQEVKLASSATYKSPKQKAEEAKSSLSALPTLAVAKEKLAELADAEFVGSECVLLAEQQADGSFHIKALSRSGTAVNAALTALYGEQKKAAA
jgi:hypothetical protein